MTLKEVRHANFLLILAHAFKGKQIDLANAIEAKEAQVTQWKKGRGFHESTVRKIEQAAGKHHGWMDVPHVSFSDENVVRDSATPPLYSFPKPSLRFALETLCDELNRVQEPERRESVGSLLRACAIAGGDTSYIDAILSVLRFKAPPPKGDARAA